MAAPRTIASVWAAKTAAFASRRLGRGGGTAISGLVGLRLQPDLIANLASQLDLGCVAITGTNGKTTTSRPIAEAARPARRPPLVDDASVGHATLEHASDATACRCGARLVHDMAFIGHVGHWRCDACGRKRPEPAFAARDVQLADGRSLKFTLVTPAGSSEVSLPI